MLHPSLTEIFNLDLKIKALTGIWRLNEINFSSQDIIQYEVSFGSVQNTRALKGLFTELRNQA